MIYELQPRENLSRLVRAYMFLKVEDTSGCFFAPAIKRSGIVIALQSNVEINCNHKKYIPPVVSMKGAFELPYYYSYIHQYVTSFAADLYPIGMYELTGKPGITFKNKFVSASQIWTKNEVKELFSALSRDIPLQERSVLFDDFLENKAPDILSEKSLLVEKADNMARKQDYQWSVKMISRAIGVSERTLGRAFKEVVGLTPKQYFTTALFEDMVNECTNTKERSIGKFLYSPFYDFSHINKWFKKFAHTSPREFASLDLHSIAAVLSRV